MTTDAPRAPDQYEGGSATVRVDYPTHALDGRVFKGARREVLEIRPNATIQGRACERRWRARASGTPGWLAIDCWVVTTEDGDIGLPAAVCHELKEKPPCPTV